MPEYRVFLDGNSWCATASGFVNLQESNCGFGDTPLIALSELMAQEQTDHIHELCREHARLGVGA